MKLTDEDIKAYAVAWKEQFGEVLTLDQAHVEEIQTTELFTLLAAINDDWSPASKAAVHSAEDGPSFANATLAPPHSSSLQTTHFGPSAFLSV